MSGAYMYKGRTYEEIVTVKRKEENGEFEVKINKLPQLPPDNDDRFEKFKGLVTDAVENLQYNLNEYAKNEFLRDLYTYPEKFQQLKHNLKSGLTWLSQSIAENNSVSKEALGQYKKLAKQLDQLRTFNKEAKKVAAADFGIMTAKTINNAIASWVALYTCVTKKLYNGKELSGRKIQKILNSTKGKDTLTYWENKLTDLSEFKATIDEEEINVVKQVVEQEKTNICRAAGDIRRENIKKK